MLRLALLAIGFFAAAPVAAQQCVPYSALVAAAKEQYGELPLVEFDRDGTEGRFVILVNPETKTATLVFVLPGELACAPIGGTSFRPAAAPKGDPA